jgi:hypothetical protein
MFDPALISPMSRNSGAVRTWVLLWLQRRRRKRQAELVPSGPSVPAAPRGLSAEDLGGSFRLSWDMSAVELEDGCSIEVRDLDQGTPFTEIGTTDPDVDNINIEANGSTNFECRVRSFNAFGYSAYSEVLTVNLV